MRPMSDEELDLLPGGVNQCAASIALTASVGGLFGGVGALVGAIAAATGPNCLSWW